MTAHFLHSELANLVLESKRKRPELKTAAEKSLEDLKALNAIPEDELSTELRKRPSFIDPFLIAFNSRDIKFTGLAIVCLQRMIVFNALANSKLNDLVESLRDAASLSQDIQLRILQSLSPLFQNYQDDIHGELLANSLHVCSVLQASKHTAVSHTAAATLQQLVVSIFENVVSEDRVAQDPSHTARAAADDALRVFKDLCLLTDEKPPLFLKLASVQETSTLELIESVLANHAELFFVHNDLADILKGDLVPFLIKALSEQQKYRFFVRVARISSVLLRNYISLLVWECEVMFKILERVLESKSSSLWKRAIAMEIYSEMYSTPNLILTIFKQYDARNDSDGRQQMVGHHLYTLASIAGEKPSSIGLNIETFKVVANSKAENFMSGHEFISGKTIQGKSTNSKTSGESKAAGISSAQSWMRIRCLDQLDKADAPMIPESYIYSLVLECLSHLSGSLYDLVSSVTSSKEGRAKQRIETKLLEQDNMSTPAPEAPSRASGSEDLSEKEDTNDFSKPNDERDLPGLQKKSSSASRSQRVKRVNKLRVLVNPLHLDSSPALQDIQCSSKLLDQYWSSLLSICSTYLCSSLDARYHEKLLQSLQEYVMVAGLLELRVPRDAFLRALGYSSFPPSIASSVMSSPSPSPLTPSAVSQPFVIGRKEIPSGDGMMARSSLEGVRGYITSGGTPALEIRNISSLRALMKLGIVLGPLLELSAWVIILKTLQRVQFSIRSLPSRTANPGSSDIPETSESVRQKTLQLDESIDAAEDESDKLFESSKSLPQAPFVGLLEACCGFFESSPSSPDLSLSLKKPRQNYQDSTSHEEKFALYYIALIVKTNIWRFRTKDQRGSGWQDLVTRLVLVSSTEWRPPSVRLASAEALSELTVQLALSSRTIEVDARGAIQTRLLHALQSQIDALDIHSGLSTSRADDSDLEVHRKSLEALEAILEQCGEDLVAGWNDVFAILLTAFQHLAIPRSRESSHDMISKGGPQYNNEKYSTKLVSTKLIRSSFSSIQLICSDFLSSIPKTSIKLLIDVLFGFCSQLEDLNVSLTAITFFWNLSDFLLNPRGQKLVNGSNSSKYTDASSPTKWEQSSRTHLIGQGFDRDNWLLSLQRLKDVSTDQRAEVRNGSLQTLLRILDVNGGRIDADCLEIIFEVMKANDTGRRSLESVLKNDGEALRQWNETTITVIKGVAGLFADHLYEVEFESRLIGLLNYLGSTLDYQYLDIRAAVFSSLKGIAEQVREPDTISASQTEIFWKVWQAGLSNISASSTPELNNQDALVAYVQCFNEIYRICNRNFTSEEVRFIIRQLYQCVIKSDAPAYSSDVEYLTPLQTQVLMAMRLIRHDISDAPSLLLAGATTLALLSSPSHRVGATPSRPTWIALSRSSLELAQSIVLSHEDGRPLFRSGAVTKLLNGLCRLIKAKYQFGAGELKGRPPWLLATDISISVVTHILPTLISHAIPTSISQDIWSAIADIAASVASAVPEAADPLVDLEAAESLDIKSVTALHELIIPNLGATTVPNQARELYIKSLYSNSNIHQVDVDEQIPENEDVLIKSIDSVRRGRTFDPPPSKRSRMSYKCLDLLFSLVSRHDGSPERIKLSEVTRKFFYARVARTINGYVADQPLRGRMPQPGSQRAELLVVLQKLLDMESEPGDASSGGISTRNGTIHLRQLLPSIGKAIPVAGADQGVLNLLGALCHKGTTLEGE